jgi:hypothetical protein
MFICNTSKLKNIKVDSGSEVNNMQEKMRSSFWRALPISSRKIIAGNALRRLDRRL